MSLNDFLGDGERMEKAGKETIIVEFEVEDTVDHGFGLVSKMLRFRGERTRYKAVIKDGKLIGIVRRRYTVVPNELVVRMLRKAGFEIGESLERDARKETRMIIRLPLTDDGKFEVMVTNSEDSTLALATNLLVFGVVVDRRVVERMNIPVAYRRHIGNIDLDDLIASIEAVRGIVAEHGDDLARIFSLKVDDAVLEIVRESRLGKKLKEAAEMMAGESLSSLFSALSRMIWSKRLKPNVRLAYLKEVGSILWQVIVAKNLL